MLHCVTRQRTRGPSGRRLPTHATSSASSSSQSTENEKENQAEAAAAAHHRLDAVAELDLEPEVDIFNGWFLPPTPFLPPPAVPSSDDEEPEVYPEVLPTLHGASSGYVSQQTPKSVSNTVHLK